MKRIDILNLLDGKWEDGTRPKDLFAQHISQAPKDYVDVILAGLQSDNRKVQNGCSELCSLVAEAQPALLVAHLHLFQKNLDARKPILRWEAACTLGHLAAVDKTGAIRANVPMLIGYLRDKSIVLQGHCVRALVRIVKKFPDLGPEILDALLASCEAFPGNRIGFIVEATEAFVGNTSLVPKVVAFVEPYAESDMASVKTKARKVLKQVPRSVKPLMSKKAVARRVS